MSEENKSREFIVEYLSSLEKVNEITTRYNNLGDCAVVEGRLSNWTNSIYVYHPTFIERIFGITMSKKIDNACREMRKIMNDKERKYSSYKEAIDGKQ